jgi:hypothetical protein
MVIVYSKISCSVDKVLPYTGMLINRYREYSFSNHTKSKKFEIGVESKKRPEK